MPDGPAIRVAFLCDHLEIGGQEFGCLEVLRRLDRRRFRPFVYAFRPGTLVDDFRALGVPLFLGHDKPGVNPTWTERDETARKTYRRTLARRLRADAVDVALVYAWRDGIPAAEEAGVSAIVERIDGPHLDRKIRDKSSCRRMICESRLARDILVAQRQLLGCDPKRIAVIAKGVDRQRFDPRRYERQHCRNELGLAPDDFVIGSVGRLSAEKNHGHLVRATADLVRKLTASEAARLSELLRPTDLVRRRHDGSSQPG